jgi:hypothetical protein
LSENSFAAFSLLAQFARSENLVAIPDATYDCLIWLAQILLYSRITMLELEKGPYVKARRRFRKCD